MNNFVGRLFAGVCAALLCFSAFAIAEEDEAFPPVIPVEENEVEANVLSDLQENMGVFNPDAAYLYRIHNDAYYHIAAYNDTGSVIQMHDASKWEVHPSQQHLVHYWVQDHDIFIKPKSSCFSSYRYVMHNITKQEAIEVNLISPPLPMGGYTFRILNIEPNARLVHLSDDSVWQIDPYDSNFAYWQKGQRVLIGVNNEWRTAKHPHIIINVDMYKEPYSEADFYGRAAR